MEKEKRTRNLRKAGTLLGVVTAASIVAGHADTNITYDKDVYAPLLESTLDASHEVKIKDIEKQEIVVDLSPPDNVRIFALGFHDNYSLLPPPQTQETNSKNVYRSDCTLIRGSDYLSSDERDWFLENCKLSFISGAAFSKRSVSDWSSLVCAPEFTWECGWALSVIDCESGGDPNVSDYEIDPITGKINYFNGLFQVANGPFDPYQNAVEAHIQYTQWKNGARKISPWPNCPKEKTG